MLPASSTAERALRTLRHETVEMGGTAVLVSCAPLVGGQDILTAFQTTRDDEYEEIVDKCQDFLAEIDKETAAAHFTYAELEENEEDLAKLRSWFAKITRRDVFRAPGRRNRGGTGELRARSAAPRRASTRRTSTPAEQRQQVRARPGSSWSVARTGEAADEVHRQHSVRVDEGLELGTRRHPRISG